MSLTAKSALVNDAERKYLDEVFDCLPDSMSDFLADFLQRLTPATPPTSLVGSESPAKPVPVPRTVLQAATEVGRQRFPEWETNPIHGRAASVYAQGYLEHFRVTALGGVSKPAEPLSPQVIQLFEAAWEMMVEQQAGPEGWSMAKRWAFDKLSAAMEPFRTEYGDELDLQKVASGVSTPGGEAGGWVSVAERLPEEDADRTSDYVLVANTSGDRLVGYYRFVSRTWHEREDGRDLGNIILWQPLPALPTHE